MTLLEVLLLKSSQNCLLGYAYLDISNSIFLDSADNIEIGKISDSDTTITMEAHVKDVALTSIIDAKMVVTGEDFKGEVRTVLGFIH